MTDAVLAIIILLPLAFTFFLKSNSAVAFLALLTGYSVETLAGSDINNSVNKLNLKGLSGVDVDLFIIAAPLILTLTFSARSWGAKSKMPLFLAAALLCGLVLTIVSIPFLGSIINLNLYSSKTWPLIQHIQSPVIAIGALYSLVLIWLSKTKHHDKKHK